MAQNHYLSTIIFVITSLCIIYSQTETFSGQNPCISKTTCHECIQTPSCAWCSQPSDVFGDHPRCFQPAGQQQLHKRCPNEYVYFPSNNYIIKTARELHKGQGSAFAASGSASASQSGSASGYGSAAGGGGGSGAAAGQGSASAAGQGGAASDIVQITPQRVQMKLRAQESQSIHVYFAQAEDYPVDLYYLMDLSKSMEDDKEKLSVLGELLSSTMRKITSNFQLGFGSFVDKVVMPYVNTVESKLKEPCENCSTPYGYTHTMKLSNHTTVFTEMVKAARVSGNLDAPEGGFDAIMQAVVCKEDIGWRDAARRLLVFSTDAGFHYAGDGKLGGIIKPNDGGCHLDYDIESGGKVYTFSKRQDYPSISQLNLKVKQNAINVIFAVTEEQRAIYERLQAHIEGSSSGTLSADSSNVVELVKKQYEAIISRVELKHNTSASVEVRYYTRGTSSNMSMAEVNTNVVEKFKVGQIIDFRVDIFLKECPKDPNLWKQLIDIHPVGMHEKLIIELEMLCSCPCENPGNMDYKPFAPECSGFGTYKCGICECDGLHFGRKCECAPGQFTGPNSTLGCKPHGKPDAIECSGKGTCICNRCECDLRDNINETISGAWCECNNFSCYRHGGEICGGHGTCDCGECRCFPPWTGKACECYNATNICFPLFKENPKLCDGHGDCVCGACQCHTTAEGKYTGRYCERCPNCTEICDDLKPCVLCQMYHVGPYSDAECVEKCKNFTPIEVEVVQADEQNDEFPCVGYDDEDCRYAFVYKKINETHYTVKAQKERECPPKVFLLGIVLGVIAAVVLMGLAILLLWKLLTTIHDRREFARFEKERMMAKWDTGENPIYKQATSTFKNPTYAGKG